MKLKETTLKSKTIFKGQVFTLTVDDVSLPNNKTASREVIHHNGGVCVLAIDDNDETFLVTQYRYPLGKVLTELPAGKIDGSEDPLSTAKRELIEETGYQAQTWIPLGVYYPTPGYSNEVIHLFAAKDLSFVGQHLDEEEFLSLQKVSLAELQEQLISGTINDGKSFMVFFRYLSYVSRETF